MGFLHDLRLGWLLSELHHAHNLETIREAELRAVARLDVSSMTMLRARRRLERARKRVARIERALKS